MYDSVSAALAYFERGWNPLPLRPGEKRPSYPEWQHTKTNPETYSALFKDQNVGVGLGEISGNIADVDLDHILMVKLFPVFARSFNAVTPAVFGRASKNDSHHIYQLPETDVVAHISYRDVDGTMLAEIRGNGNQTMFPPSMHPDGERVEWRDVQALPLQVPLDHLKTILGWCSAAVTLINGWSQWSTQHHTMIGALAGTFARGGMGARTAESFVQAVSFYVGDHEPHDRERIVRDTYSAFESGAPITGFPTLRDIIGTQRAKLLVTWLGLTTTDKTVNCTDDGNAMRLVRMFGESIRYVHEWKSWLLWDGTRWAKDGSENIIAYAREVPNAIRKDAVDAQDDDVKKALDKWASASQHVARIHAIPTLARSDEAVKVASHLLDADPWAFNVENGTINLRTGGITAHDKRDFNTKLSPVRFDANAKCPQWERYIASVFAGDDTLPGFVQRLVGYSLTGKVSEHIFMIMYGPHGTGKTTFVNVIRRLMGDYGRNADPTTFMQKKHTSRANPEVAELQGARFVSSSETEENEKLATALVKRLSGDSRITVSHLYGSPFEFDPVLKLWIDTNHRPRINAHDDAAWARLVLIPFLIQFRGTEYQIQDLDDILMTELPGILNWAIEGCLAWQVDGLQRPAKVSDALDAYRADSDALQIFLDDVCVVEAAATCASHELFTTYAEWAKTANEFAFNMRTFKQRLQERGFICQRTEAGMRWRGVRPASNRHTSTPGFDPNRQQANPHSA